MTDTKTEVQLLVQIREPQSETPYKRIWRTHWNVAPIHDLDRARKIKALIAKLPGSESRMILRTTTVVEEVIVE